METKHIKKTIGYFVSAPCSSGKTYAACHHIRDHNRDSNFIYVAPSLELLDQTKSTLEQLGLKPTLITSEKHPNVRHAIIGYLKTSEDVGCVLLITWQAFEGLPYRDRPKNWQLIIDEVPQIDRLYKFDLAEHANFVTEFIELEGDGPSDKLCRVSIKNRGALEEKLSSKTVDNVEDVFREFRLATLNDKKDMYVDTASWNESLNSEDGSKANTRKQFFFLSMLRPEAIEGCIILGANVEDSLLVRWLDRNDYKLVEHKEIKSRLRKAPSNLGNRLRVSYFIPDRAFSKALSNRVVDGSSLIDRMDRTVVDVFGDERFLYVANNSRKSGPIEAAHGARRISVISHGLNSFDTFNNIYFSAALNREPKHFQMLGELGFDRECIHRAHAQEVGYQAVMRTSLRNPNSNELVHAIVPDEPTANRLKELIGAREICQIGALIDRSRHVEPYSRSDINKRQAATRLLEDLKALKTIPSTFIKNLGMESGAFLERALEGPKVSNTSTGFARGSFAALTDSSDDLTENSSHVIEEGNPNCIVTFHKTLWSNGPDEHHVVEGLISEFIAYIKTFARAKVSRKEESELFTPCYFQPELGSSSYRTKRNFRQSSFLVLDFDGGLLSPENFESIFGSDAKRGQKHSFLICNTFSRCEASPNKFRVIMFYCRPAKSLEQHEAAYSYVVSRLEEHGFTEDSSKLDRNCRSGVQPFYLPCTNRHHPEWAFLRTYKTKMRELRQCAIDPVEIAARFRTVVPVLRVSQGEIRLDEQTIRELTAPLQGLTEGRHKPNFIAVLRLTRAGYQPDKIRSILRVVWNNDPKMSKKVEDALRSTAKYVLRKPDTHCTPRTVSLVLQNRLRKTRYVDLGSP